MDTLNVSDFGATTGDSNVVVGPSTITGFADGTITYRAIGGKFSSVNLHGSQGTSTFTVTSNSTTLNLFGDAGAGHSDAYVLTKNATIHAITGNSAGHADVRFHVCQRRQRGVRLVQQQRVQRRLGVRHHRRFFGHRHIERQRRRRRTHGREPGQHLEHRGRHLGQQHVQRRSHKLSFSGFSTLDGGTAADTFNLADGAAGYTLNGGGARNGVDEVTGASNAVLTGSAASGFSGMANGGAAPTGVNFSQIGELQGSGSLTSERTTSTWTVYAASAGSTYSDGIDRLTFTGFTTLNAGNEGDTFNLQPGAAGYSLNGGAGTDTLNAVADAVLSSSSGGGCNGMAGDSIRFTSIDVLDGTGSLTNEEDVPAIWTVDANPTYDDGSRTLSFGGFETLNGGTAGDTFYVTAASSPLTLNGNGGAGDTFTLGVTGAQDIQTDGSLGGVTASITINGSPDAILNVSDAADTSAVAWTITANDIQSGSAGDIVYNGPSNINVYFGLPMGGNRNAVDVETLQPSANLLLQDQGLTDYQFAQVGQDLFTALSGTSINLASSNSGTDTLALNDQLSTNVTAYDVSDLGVTFGAGSITFLGGGPGALVVSGSSAADTFNVVPSGITAFSLVDGSNGSSTLNYEASQVHGPPDKPNNDSFSSISDLNGYYQTVFYFEFNPTLVNVV